MDALHVISFPKSGRTWLRVMLDDIGLQANYSHDGSDHILRCKIVDLNPDKSRYSRLTILLMVRDPRDTVVSGYFQVTRRLKIEGNFLTEFIQDDRHGIELERSIASSAPYGREQQRQKAIAGLAESFRKIAFEKRTQSDPR